MQTRLRMSIYILNFLVEEQHPVCQLEEEEQVQEPDWEGFEAVSNGSESEVPC